MPEAINLFTEGMIMDVHPLMTPNNMLTNALNATVITFNGNEFMLLNDMGNGRVETAFLPPGYVPVGVKEYGGIIYIASYNPIKNQSLIGCFPSPERLISSDEVELPKQKLTDEIFGLTGSNYQSIGATTEYTKLEIFEKDKVFNPGDQFMIAIRQGNLNKPQGNSALGRILSYYGMTKEYLDITIHLAILDDTGNVTTIEKDLLKDKETNYWMPYYENQITGIQDPDLYRASIGNTDKYNIFKSKISGQLVLIVELEGMNNFDFYRNVDIVYTGLKSDLDPNNEEDALINYDRFNVTFTGSALKYTEQASADFNGYKMHYKLYNDKDELQLEGDLYRNDGTTTHPKNEDILLDLTLNYNDSSKDGFTRKHKLKYEVVPFTDFLYLDRYKKTGIIDFSKINSGVHELTEWRYYIDNNSVSLSYGFDYNPLEGHRVTEVYFELFDVKGNFSVLYSARRRDNWSGNFTDSINFRTDATEYEIGTYNNPDENKVKIPINKQYQVGSSDLKKDNLYLVRICLREQTSTGDFEDTEYFRYLYTTPIFNVEYVDNFATVQDFAVLDITPVLEVITEDTGESMRLISEEDDKQIFNSDVSDPEKLLVSDKKGKVQIQFTSKILSSLLNPDLYFGDFNQEVLDTYWVNEDPNIELLTEENRKLVTVGNYIEGGQEELDKGDELNEVVDFTKTADSKVYSLILNVLLNRRIVASPTMTSVKYSGRKLQRYFKNEYFLDPNSYTQETLRRIGGAVRIENDAPEGSRWQFTFNTAIIMGRESIYTGAVSAEGARDPQDHYMGGNIDDALFNAATRQLAEPAFNRATVIPIAMRQAPHSDNYYKLLNNRTHTSNHGIYRDRDKGEFVANSVFMCWRAYPGLAGAVLDDYYIMNMQSSAGNTGIAPDNNTSGGRMMSLTNVIATFMNKLLLVQFDNFEEPVLVAKDIMYYDPYNNTINVNIKYGMNNSLSGPIFTFETDSGIVVNFYNDLDSSGGFFSYLSTVVNSDILDKFKEELLNNIPVNSIDNVILVDNEEKTLQKSFTYGSSLRLNSMINQYSQGVDYVKSTLESGIIDENGKDVDGNGLPYNVNTVYITEFYSKEGGYEPGIYPTNKLPALYAKGIVIREINSDRTFTILDKATKLFRTSYQSSGEQLGVLNQPLIDGTFKGDNRVTRWQRGAGHTDPHSPDIMSDLVLSSTFLAAKASRNFYNKTGNTNE